jgi:uncharacterized membrane-anchored protein
MVLLPKDHPQRVMLTNEVHARPSQPIQAQSKISCIALKTQRPFHDDDREIVRRLTDHFDAPPPEPGKKHHRIELGTFSLVWEHHTEFVRYTIIVEDPEDKYTSAVEILPEEWLASLEGEVISATHVFVEKKADPKAYDEQIKRHFSERMLIGAEIADGIGVAVTDFHLHEDGFCKFLVLDAHMSPLHIGRIVQRLLEIDTYRILALLALPVAQKLILDLSRWEIELSQITDKLTEASAQEDTNLLDRLTQLQASIERSTARSQFRFGAAAAYYSLVQRRTLELREARLPDMQMFGEFIERRLAPAMATSTSVEARQKSLSQRVDRATQLLSTKVNLSLEQQNQSLMASMDRRAELQLRLQQTVEGLSIAAISYYLIGIVNYAAKGIYAAGVKIDPTLITGASIPLVLSFTAFSVWRLRKHLSEHNLPDKD